jgi:outer membrane protein OmpA-like peptidoglycan-associated protein
MKLATIDRFGLGLIVGAALAIATGCASSAGWGPAPPNTGVPVAKQQGAPTMVQTTGMRLTKKEEAVRVPPWIRVQDCAIVAISTPTRYACPDGRVYTSFELSRSRTGEYVVVAARQPPIELLPFAPQSSSSSEVSERIILRGVHFDFNRANIRSQDEAVLDEAAGSLKSHPNLSVDVNGYCDSIGKARYNLRLSERRADAVVKYLAEHGIAESRLSPHGFGKTDFVASNSTEEGRAQNRRVELVPNQ